MAFITRNPRLAEAGCGEGRSGQDGAMETEHTGKAVCTSETSCYREREGSLGRNKWKEKGEQQRLPPSMPRLSKDISPYSQFVC